MNKSRRPRRSGGAAGTPNQTEMHVIMLKHPQPFKKSRFFDNFSHLVRHTLRRRARLMEPVGARRFSEESGAVFSANKFMAERSNFESVSSKV